MHIPRVYFGSVRKCSTLQKKKKNQSVVFFSAFPFNSPEGICMLTVGCTATSLGRADGIRTGEHLTGHPVLCGQLGTLRAEKTYTIGMSLTQASSSHQPGAQGGATVSWVWI